MYVLDSNEFTSLKLGRVRTFVRYWSQFCGHGPKHVDSDRRIDYETELNFGANLTQQNIRNLLRWKDVRYLTHVIVSGNDKGKTNVKVANVLRKQKRLNQFRNGEIDETTIRRCVDRLFPNGIIYRVFLLHICRPLEYPIADQHVFRSFTYHTGVNGDDTWEKYEQYRKYFFMLAKQLPSHDCPHEKLRSLKSVDSALMMFGQFLNIYGNNDWKGKCVA